MAKQMAFYVDLRSCVGCKACQIACKDKNDLGPDRVYRRVVEVTGGDWIQQGDAWTTNAFAYYLPTACMHCEEAPCVKACPTTAMYKREDGVVLVDQSKCIGCRYCEYACPFDVPTFGWDGALGVISKCDYCQDRLAEGEKTACASACPTGALKGGTREEMLAEAHARIKANPDHYVNHVYGEFEVGGTSRLYISDVPFEELGFKGLPEQRVAQYSEPIMKRTPVIALGVATVATGLFSLLGRHAEHGHEHTDSE